MTDTCRTGKLSESDAGLIKPVGRYVRKPAFDLRTAEDVYVKALKKYFRKTKESMIKFQPINIEMKELVDGFLLPCGERSCQHSFAALYAMGDKYRTEISVSSERLFVRQKVKDEENYESFLMPFCHSEKKLALEELQQDVHKRGKKVKLQTITESAKEFLEREFPHTFLIEEKREYAEYLYTSERLCSLQGSDMSNVRQFYRRFWRRYGGKIVVDLITEKEIPEVLEFQKGWLAQRRDREDYDVLKAENHAIEKVCADYRRLGFSGITVRQQGHICGYAMGCEISENTFDVFFEKGDTSVRDIYRCLVTDMIKIHGKEYAWINREEDLGDEGMRYSKMSYRPDVLMKKYIAREA